MDWFDSWALSLAVFIPIVGAAVVLAIPKAKEELLKAGRPPHHRRHRWPSA